MNARRGAERDHARCRPLIPSQMMHRSGRMVLLVALWLGAALRFHGLFANSFHADEALFASWAREIAIWRDPLLLAQAVDKPPLLFYTQALFYPLFGPVEWAARLPSFIASLLLIPLTAQLARRLTGSHMASIIAALVMAITPLTIQFSGTAFSDPLLGFWLTAALYAAASPDRTQPLWRDSSFWAGLLFALALATKYQAILFAPLLLGLGWLSGQGWPGWRRVVAGTAPVVVLFLLWQAARAADGDIVMRQWANIGGVRLARSWELWPRLAETIALWRMAVGWPLLVTGLVAAAGGMAFARRRRSDSAALGMLALFVAGYALLHWLWAVPVWDRYLLPILPLVAVLMGGGLAALRARAGGQRLWQYTLYGALVLGAIAHIPTAANARAGRWPIGGRPDADGGAAEVALLLKDAPYGTVLYDHWYSWHWHYQLFDAKVYVSWFPHIDSLLDDLAVFAGRGPARYIALPDSPVARPVVRRLRDSGYVLEPVAGQDGSASMFLYRIVVETAE